MQKLLLFCWLALALPASGAEIKINFGNSQTGQIPAGFHSARAGGGQPSDWKIIMDDVPPLLVPFTPQAPSVTRRAVLAQTSQDPTNERFPMLIYDGETFRDFKLTTRFKIVSGEVEQMAGMVFRFQNESNFYVMRASALGHNLRFYKVVDGVRTDPIGPQMDISTNAWHTLAVQCQGNQINCWLDEHLAMPTLNDNTFASGKIGFWTKSDAVSYFSDTAITYTPRVPAAQALVKSLIEKYPRTVGLQIYTLDDKSLTHIIASKDEKEIGRPGTDAEKAAITDGTISFGRGIGTVALTMPFRDRNGDPMAAVRLELRSFKGETEDTAVTRARTFIKEMQAQVTSSDELTQ